MKKSRGKQDELNSQLILLDVSRDEWIKEVKLLQEDYNIRQETKTDEVSARRIAILFGEMFIRTFRGRMDVIKYVPIIEKDCYDIGIENRLVCDPLEREERIKPHLRKQVLRTWGVDKSSGVEGYTTQLKELIIMALIKVLEAKEKEEENHGIQGEESGSFDIGGRSLEGSQLEKAGVGCN
jgi:hypothetical protein